MIDYSKFSSRLRYWTIHAFFCATPSFIFAYTGMGYDRVSSVLAMLLAILVFILGYSLVTSSNIYSSKIDGKSWLKKIVHRAAVFRSFVSGLGFISFTSPSLQFLFVPDIYAGILASILTTRFFEFFGYSFSPRGLENPMSPDIFWLGDQYSFIPTFVMTVCEGLIITATILALVCLFSFFHYLFRKRKA